jgi:hypothetical protein
MLDPGSKMLDEWIGGLLDGCGFGAAHDSPSSNQPLASSH